jgi:hypothetical protein
MALGYRPLAGAPLASHPVAAAVYQYARPASDIAAGGWLPSTGVDLYAMIDEAAADDADYIYSSENPAAAVNLLTASNAFDDAVWLANHTVVYSNVAVAPDGSMTADKVCPDNTFSAGGYYLRQDVTKTGSTYYTNSMYAKAAEYDICSLATMDAGSFLATATFDLTNGIYATSGKGSASMTAVGSGWYRCTWTVRTQVGGAAADYFYTKNITGDNVSGVYFWGAQVSLAPSAQQFEVLLSATNKPAAGSSMTANVRLQAVNLDTYFDLNLLEGTTVRDSWTELVTPAQGAVTRTRTVASAIVDPIANFADLRVRGTARE